MEEGDEMRKSNLWDSSNELRASLLASDCCDETLSGCGSNTPTEEVNSTIDEAIDAIGTSGPFQNRIMWTSGMAFMVCAVIIAQTIFLSLYLTTEWNLNNDRSAFIMSTLFAGFITGIPFLGPMGDIVGRRPVFMIGTLIITLTSIGTVFINGLPLFLFTRVIIGFGLGFINIPFDVLSEFSSSSSRSKNLVLIELFYAAGAIYVPVIGYFSIHSLRLFNLLISIPCLVCLFLAISFLPESPRWLISQGRKSEAIAILKAAAVTNGENPDYVFLSGSILKHDGEEHKAHCCALFDPKWRQIIFLLWTLYFTYGYVYYGTIFVTTRIFESKKGGEFNYFALAVSASADVFGALISLCLVDSIGRILSQIGAYILTGLSALVLCLLVDTTVDKSVLIFFAFLTRGFAMTASTVTWICTAEVLSTEIRSTGHSSAVLFSQIGTFVCPYFLGDNESYRNIGISLIIISFISAISASRLPETKGKGMGQSMKLVDATQTTVHTVNS